MRGIFILTIAFFTSMLTVKSNFCMNYGHHSDSYDLVQVSNDLDRLAESGITCLRIAAQGWNNPESEALALLAKLKGFNVIIGGDWPELYSSELPTYHDQVIQEAVWAEASHIDQFSLGNEQEYRLPDMTNEAWVAFLHSLAVDVRSIYSGLISYETSGDFVDFWATQTLGDIDMLGLNLYCGFDCNANYLRISIESHGVDHVYVSETNADMDVGFSEDSEHAQEVSSDFLRLLDFGVPVYYFAYDTCGGMNGVDDHWGLYQCGILAQPLTAQTLAIR